MLAHDFRMAVRSLLARRRTNVLAAATLAIGLGAATSMFSLVNTVLLRPLDFPDEERLVKILGHHDTEQKRANVSPADFYDLAAQSRSFEILGAHGWVGLVTVTGDAPAVRVGAVSVTAGFFETLGVEPAMGRWFRRDEDVHGVAQTTLLTHGFWQSRFGGSIDVVGREILVNSKPHRVIGVLPEHFRHPEPNPDRDPQLYRLYQFSGTELSRSGRFLRAIGRLQQDRSLVSARAEMESLASRLAEQYPESNRSRSIRLSPLKESIVGGSRRGLVVLLCAVALFLLIACVNLANLQLGQLAHRRQEIATQMALGASFGRLVRQLTLESGIVSLVGGAVALVATYFAIPLMSLRRLPRAADLGIDGAVFAFTFTLCAVTTMSFGLFPALRIRSLPFGLISVGPNSRVSLSNASRRVLIGAQVALAVTLLVGAGLFTKSLWMLTDVSPGFETEQLITTQLALPLAEYPEGDQIPFYRELYGALDSQSAIESVGATNILPLTLNYSSDAFQIDDHPTPRGQSPSAEARSVNPSYFNTMRIQLHRGRLFDARERQDSSKVVLISQSMADKFWPNLDPIGKRITYNKGVEQPTQFVGGHGSREIVGIVSDVRHFGLDRAPAPTFYTPQTQPPSFHAMHLVVRTTADPAFTVSVMRQVLERLDANVPLYGVRTLDQLLTGSTEVARLRTNLIVGFALVSLCLALFGIYAVVTLAIGQRTRELGIRMALGADRGRVRRMLFSDNLRPLLSGLVLGIALAWGLSSSIRGLLYDTEPTDPLVYAGLSTLVLLTGLATVAIPARRITRIEPARALRTE